MPNPLIVDAHLDFAWNVLAFGRDYTRSVVETRRLEAEAASPALEHQGNALLGWPEFQSGRVALIFSTLFVTPLASRQAWETIFYANYDEAHRLYRQQLDVYHELAERVPDKFRLIGSRPDLDSLLEHWANDSATAHPVGLLPLMEGAEGVRSPAELELWWENGVRIIGLAWSGTRYCGGTRHPGPLTDEGRTLLKAMADLGFILDISHMDELSARQSLDLYPGGVIASHANVAALIPGYSGNRHLNDDVIKALIARGGVIGLTPTCRFLDYNWKRGDRRENVPLDMTLAHVEHICELAGNTQHVGLGSDYDGGFGLEAVPAEVDSLADLQKLAPGLILRGFTAADSRAFFADNWIRILQEHLPA
jgi:membrane dipeptidase